MSLTYEFCIDWDATDWTQTPDFTSSIDNITSYVKSQYSIDRGENNELGNAISGTLDLTLDNSSGYFSPYSSASPFYGKIRPWLPVRVRATVSNDSPLTVYSGYIASIALNPHLDTQEAYFYCTDGMDLLARNMVTANNEERTTQSDGDSVNDLLDAAGWPSHKRSIDTDGGDIVVYPQITIY